MWRTAEQIEFMRAQASDPFQVENFLDKNEITELLATFAGAPAKEKKATGPVCAPYTSNPWLDRKIRSLVGDARIFHTSLFFRTEVPHVLHCDASIIPEMTPGKAILLPLAFEADRSIEAFDISFFVFQQRWYGYPAKFFKGETAVYSPYNRPVYDYAAVEGLRHDAAVDGETQARWLSHLRPAWLEGMSISRHFDWTVGSAIVFDSFQVHCGSNFRARGVKWKIGLSIFTGPEPRPPAAVRATVFDTDRSNPL